MPAPFVVPVHDAPRCLPEPLAALRRDLAGFTVDAVAELLGPVATAALAREQVVPALHVLEEGLGAGGPLTTLVRGFLLGRPAPRGDWDAALPRCGAEGAVQLGLLDAAGAADDDPVRPRVVLRPYAATDALGPVDWWLVSDLDEAATGRPLAEEHVLGAGGASLMLARSTLRRPVGRLLDVGTGCGVQLLHAARHAERLTGTDLSARALAFARFTLALNEVDRLRPVDLRHGDLLEPVAGEQFDLVVSNPPFVITPQRSAGPRYTYRDGGRPGDEVVRRLVTGLGAVLAPGGVAQLLGNWEHPRDRSWQERLEGWLAESGLDGWVVERDRQDPAEYAELWLRDAGVADPDREREWLRDFERRGVEAVGFGLIVLRRPADGAAPTLRRVEAVTSPVDAPLGEHLADCLAAHDWLATRDDAALLTARLTVAPDVSEERHHRPGDADPQVILLRQGGGFQRAVRADSALAGLVGACDGELAVGQLLAAVAALLDQPRAELTELTLPTLRGLIADGFLIPG